ncbi:NAD(P)H-dependent flavin oxidoreductase [Comamonas antarctica]|uniref:Nitronate monooxygenase n=1 Tax=Comamonas antarctica TaxID=2743470 RepID=A0A6N1XC71_9BURK|nr:nitronate monooxygenase family protein [Comamonas antarctica]QKV55565.1 nitronate monooxygenase [Comamonas antarctica]
MKTRVTEKLGIEYPIIQGGMQWVGLAELASAVSNAGGLGILTGLTQATADDLRQEIARCRRMTHKPFGVNLTMLPSSVPRPYAEYVAAIVDSGVKIVETAGRIPEEFIRTFRQHGITIVHKCTTVRHALSAERAGVDMVSIDGLECAGHPGEDDVGGLVLIPAAARALKIPVIASGGIADGRGLAAALVLGAEGVNMGTRFCVTREAPIHEHIKQAYVAGSERDTALIYRTLKNTARVFRNEIAEQVRALEAQPGGCAFEDLRPLVVGTRGRAALESGEVHGGILSAGQCIGLIHDIPSCEELIERMVAECRERLSRASRWAAPDAADDRALMALAATESQP